MPVPLRVLAMRKEALRDDEVQIVLGARHRDIQRAALLRRTVFHHRYHIV